MGKTLYSDLDKSRRVRRILLAIHIPPEKGQPTDSFSWTHTLGETVESRLREILSTLQLHTTLTLRLPRLSIRRRDGQADDLAVYLKTLPDGDLPLLRIVLDTTGEIRHATTQGQELLVLSLLSMGGSYEDGETSDVLSSQPCDTKTRIVNAVIDIMLDVVIANAFVESADVSFSSRAELTSRVLYKKFDFIEKRTNPSSQEHSRDKYVSFSQINRRNATHHDLGQLMEDWSLFWSEIEHALPKREAVWYDPLEHIRLHHKHSGSMNVKDLKKRVSGLSPGAYVLVTVLRKAKTEELRLRLEGYLGRKPLKRHMSVVLSRDDGALRSLYALFPHVVFFPFQVK